MLYNIFMPRRNPGLVNGEIYHVFNRGVEKRKTFLTDKDFEHFLETLDHYQSDKSKLSRRAKNSEIRNPKIVEILCFVLMPNHFHLLLKQREDDGISTFMNRVQNSFAKYFNTKNDRVGPLFQGPFKSIRVGTDEQLVHVSRYIHLNPLVSGLVDNLEKYSWSSFHTYIGSESEDLVELKADQILGYFNSTADYKKFVLDHAEYAKSLETLKHHLVD